MTYLRQHLSKVNLAQPNFNAPWVSFEHNAGAGLAYRIGLIYHLAGAENGGQHNIFVDIVDSNGHIVGTQINRIGWNWEENADRAPASYAMDKRPPEPAGNLPIFAGAIVRVWIEGPNPSDIVKGLRVAGYPELDTDAATGNYPGHNSYYLVFVRVDAGHVEPPPAPPEPAPVEPPTPPAPGDLGARVAALEADNAALHHRLDLLEQFLGWKG